MMRRFKRATGSNVPVVVLSARSGISDLLQPDELFIAARRAALRVCAFEQGSVSQPRQAIVQRMVAWRSNQPQSLR